MRRRARSSSRPQSLSELNRTETPFSDTARIHSLSVLSSTTIVFTEDTSPITNDDAVFIFSGDARTTVSAALPENRRAGNDA